MGYGWDGREELLAVELLGTGLKEIPLKNRKPSATAAAFLVLCLTPPCLFSATGHSTFLSLMYTVNLQLAERRHISTTTSARKGRQAGRVPSTQAQWYVFRKYEDWGKIHYDRFCSSPRSMWLSPLLVSQQPCKIGYEEIRTGPRPPTVNVKIRTWVQIL